MPRPVAAVKLGRLLGEIANEVSGALADTVFQGPSPTHEMPKEVQELWQKLERAEHFLRDAQRAADDLEQYIAEKVRRYEQ